MPLELSEAEARARLEAETQASSEPTLLAADIDALLEYAKRADTEGLAPSDTGWTETWDLSAAAAEGWRRKAGKVAGRFNVTADGAVLSRAQIFAHCLMMAEQYGKKSAGSISLSLYPDETNVVGNL